MTIRERLEAFWAGERPDEIPYTIYHTKWEDAQDDPSWAQLFEDGLGLTFKEYPFRLEHKDLDVIQREAVENGRSVRHVTWRTSRGEISARWTDGWQEEHRLKSAEDYRVMTHIVENTEIVAEYDSFGVAEQRMQPYAVTWSMVGRTPLQEILVDYAGLESFSFHLFDYEEEVRQLYEALLEKFRRKAEIVAAGPGRFVSNLENFTAETLGPDRYEEFLLPVYEECFAPIHEAGKIIGSHYDGKTACVKDLIARAPIDLIESLTPAPEGDLSLAECRAAWPTKLFWSNLNASVYELPPAELHRLVLDRVQEAAPDGRRLAFEISEARQENWRDSIPVVLNALKETRS
ncbi:MAG: hypothetical protein EA426_14900 [Spirochaetaceae bacterium]|nr:MAG: hypothetical protein EA426_14900 [Spirochaetaceae bacterium]